MAQFYSLVMGFSKNRKKSIITLMYLFTIIIQTETSQNHPKTFNEIDNTFQLLEKGEKEMKLLHGHRNVTLVVGNTGSGKSTFIQWLAGKNPNLQSVANGTGEFIIDDVHRIGTTVMSKTLFPELVIDSKNHQSIYDCPGFSDTRSSSYDIATTYFFKKLTEHVEFVKLLLTVDYHSITQGPDRMDFVTLLRQTLDLIKNVEKFRESIGIVITKVDNTYKKKELVPDKVVISSIASYFRTLQKTLTKKSKIVSSSEKLFYHKAVTLLNILLTQNNATYSRIQIFRRPNESGPLKQISLLESRRKNIENMIYKVLKFSEKGDDDFGYAISDRSKNDVNNLVAGINDKVALASSGIVVKVQNYYKKVIRENDAQLNSYGKSLNITDIQEIERGFVKELETDHRSIVEFYTVSKNITNLKELANITKTCIITQLGISECKDEVKNLALQAKYLEFIEIVSSKSFKTRPRDWWNEFEKMGSYLGTHVRGLETFDTFLNQMLGKFSEYDVQKNKDLYNVANLNDWGSKSKTKGIQINKNNYKQFLEKLQQINVIGYNSQIHKVTVTEFQLRKLNHVLYLTLKKPWRSICSGSDTLIIQGDFVKFSDFINPNGKLIHSCDFKHIASLNIFALNVVFIDRDFRENGIQLSIIALVWKIIGSREINVDGTMGGSQTQAGTLEGASAAGVDGAPGFPGGPAGNFLGIEKYISGGSLTISASGGQGGQGQQGGNGKRGNDGRDAQHTSDFTRKFIRDDVKTIVFHKVEYLYYGHTGGMGGNGGKGGIGGFGGIAGEIKVFQLGGIQNFPTLKNNPGAVGRPGKGGNGGTGGSNGADLLAHECKHYPIARKEWCWERKSLKKGKGPNGYTGLEGGSKFNTTQPPKQGKSFPIIPNIIRSFKIYLRENFRDYFNKTIFFEFVNNIDTNSEITNSYNTQALVNELQDLEMQYQHPQDFIPFYSSLITLTSEYAKNPRNDEKSESYKIVLSHLYTALLGKINILKNKSTGDYNLIIDLYKYLDSITQNINDLLNLKEKSTKLKIVNHYRDSFEKKLQQKIENAEYLVKTQVTPAIDTVSLEIEKETDKLLAEVKTLEKTAVDRKNDLNQKRKIMKQNLVYSQILNGVKIIGNIIASFVPMGSIINTVIETAMPVAQQFLIKDVGAVTPGNFSSDLATKIESASKNLNLLMHQPFVDFKDQLRILHTDTEKYVELDDTSKLVKNMIDSCDKAQTDSDTKKLEELKHELQTELKKKISILESSTRSKRAVSGPAMLIKKAKRFLPLGRDGLKLYKHFNNNDYMFNEIDNEVQKAEQEILKAQLFQSKIYEIMTPVLEKTSENLNSVVRNLNSQSEVVLDIVQWKVQSFLKDLKLHMLQFTKGFSIESNMQRCIENLDETMTTIINIYDRMQTYQYRQQEAAYIADISSPTARDIEIPDKQLNTAMIELEKIIASNLVFEQYNAALNALKQHVFPFADYYLNSFNLGRSNIAPGFQNLINQAVKEVKGLQSKMTQYKTSIIKSDSFMKTTDFTNAYKITKPFFVWENFEYHDDISKLLSGETVLLKADIHRSASDKDAIKFNKIGIKFSSEDSTLTKDIELELEGFSVYVKHMGNSYYRVNNNIYVIASEVQEIHFSFQKNVRGEPVDRNSVYDKIAAGDVMLSPYAMWEIRIVNAGSGHDFSRFEKFKDVVNIELEGSGSYVAKDANVTNLENYYTVFETVLDDPRPRKRMRTSKTVPMSVYTFKPSTSASARLMPWFATIWGTLYEILVYTF